MKVLLEIVKKRKNGGREGKGRVGRKEDRLFRCNGNIVLTYWKLEHETKWHGDGLFNLWL